MKNRIINVKGAEVTIATRHEQDYISLTDMVRNFDGGSALIEQWLKNKDTVLFLGVWEQLNNPGFNSLEFEGIKSWVVELLPHAQEQHGVLVFEPLLNQGAASVKVPHHVGERDVVLLVPGGDGDFGPFDVDNAILHDTSHSAANSRVAITRCFSCFSSSSIRPSRLAWISSWRSKSSRRLRSRKASRSR